MTDKEILYKSILKAEKNGYSEHLELLPLIASKDKNLDDFLMKIFWKNRYQIIFSHKFAKAFFGNDDEIYTEKAWVHRLEEMAEEENEFKYLEKFLEK